MPAATAKRKTIEEKHWSPEELEEKGTLGLSSRQIRRLCESGELGGVDVGTGTRHWWKISDTAIRKFKEKRGVKR